MNIIDILGPVMVGPSSSHTAGAVRLGRIAKNLLGDRIVKAEIGLHGSFAATGHGHGTDKALVAGLLGMKPDNMNIPKSFAIAHQLGLKFSISKITIIGAHPNTVLLKAEGESGNVIEMQAASLGGGSIMINKLDGNKVNCTGEKPTLLIHIQDQPGLVASISSVLALQNLNIATLKLYREKKGGPATLVIEIDQTCHKSMIQGIKNLDGVNKVLYIERDEDDAVAVF